MNKKGFTLIELIAVIVIIGVISLIAIISMGGIRHRVDLKTIEGNFDLILISARSHGESIVTSLPYTVRVDNLLSEGLDVPKEYINIKVLIYFENRRANACINQIASETDLINLVSEDNYDNFKDYYCNKLGDINNDGVISNKDYTLYQKYINGSDKVSITKANSDLNGDNIYNSKDLTKLFDIVNEKALKKN